MNNIKRIILSVLVLLPFYEVFVYCLMPQGKLPEWIDFRITKEYIALGAALTLAVFSWMNTKISCKNKWMLFFLVFMWFNWSKTPIAVTSPIVDLSLLGNYPAEFKVFSFFLMFCGLSSLKFDEEFMQKMFKLIFYTTMGMSVYMILQALNLDQIFKPKIDYIMMSEINCASVGGVFGQPTFAVPFAAMAIPFCIYFKKYFLSIIPIIALLCTKSDFAILSMVFLVLIYAWGKRRFIPISVIILISMLMLFMFKPLYMFTDNGRFNTWSQILSDVFSGEINGVPVRIGMFGAGLNNFGEIFTALHKSAYTHAHNEFLEVLWTCGVVGLFLFVMIHIDILRTGLRYLSDERIKILMICLGLIVLCSMGTFIYQLGVYQFYIVLFVSIIYQQEDKNEICKQ